MRLPGVRFTLRQMMTAVVFAGVVLAGIAAIRERQRRIVAVQTAGSAYKDAVLTRKVAEMAAAEYEHGIYKQELAAIDAETNRAELEAKDAEEVSDQKAVNRTKSVLEHARNRRTMREKNFKIEVEELRDEVSKAKADESAKNAELQRANAALVRWLGR